VPTAAQFDWGIHCIEDTVSRDICKNKKLGFHLNRDRRISISGFKRQRIKKIIQHEGRFEKSILNKGKEKTAKEIYTEKS
jgi:hypothetical protein